MKVRLTHLAFLTALVLPAFLGKASKACGWLGFSDGVW
jgi:hypothetical protein